MSNIFNRRNAALGWVAWRLGRRAAARRLKSGRISSGSRLLRVLLIGSAAAMGVGLAAAFGGRRDGGDAGTDDWL